MTELYDVAIIGGGPAGLTAGLYAARDLMKTVIFEKSTVGGLITQTDAIENYPGAPEGSDGFALTERMREQAVAAGAGIIYDQIIAVKKENGIFMLTGKAGEYTSRTVIICAGSIPRKLGIPGEAEFTGRGVSYCATCDAMFFRGKVVGVSGGGDSAVKEANFLTRFASKVYVFHRRDELRARGEVRERLLNNPKAEVVYNTVIEEILGEDKVCGVKLRDTVTGETRTMELDGVFVFNGFDADTEMYADLIERTDAGWIKTDENMATSCDGIYAAGDVRDTVLRQVVTAASDGAVAATRAGIYADEHR